MILSNYYRFIKGSGKTRFDCTHSTGDYETFEVLRNKDGDLFIHITGSEADYIKANANRKSDFKLSKTKHLSSVYILNLENPVLAYGDILENQSALIILFDLDMKAFEVFIAKGYRSHISAICNAVAAGEMEAEMEFLRNKAKLDRPDSLAA